MESSVSRKGVLFTFVLLGLAAGVAASSLMRVRASRRLELAREDLIACRTAASRIQLLRQQKQRALSQTKPSDELNRKVEEWARQAKIEGDRLVRIDPQEPRRVGDSPYLEQVTELEVVTSRLEPILRFAQLAEQSPDAPKLAQLRLSPPRTTDKDPEAAELWNVELALTYLIYSPKSASR